MQDSSMRTLGMVEFVAGLGACAAVVVFIGVIVAGVTKDMRAAKACSCKPCVCKTSTK